MTGFATLRGLCLDARDPQVVGAFWCAVLGRLQADAGQGDGRTPDVVLRAADGDAGPTIWVNGVPEPRAGKVRLHLDVDLALGRGVEELLVLGATIVT